MTATDPNDPAPPSLARSAARGAFVTYAGQGTRILVQVGSVIVLSRLLAPGDYGLLAMVLAVIGVGEIFRDFGLSSAAVQAKTLSAQQKTNLFWINAGIGLVLAGLVFASGGVLSAIYGRDELIGITHALSATFIINGLATQFRADLLRNLKFSRLAAADVLSPVVGVSVAIVAALAGWGYWALVVQQLTQGLVLLVAAVIMSRWWPGLPRRGAEMGGLVKFGSNLVATQLIGYVSNNLDSVVIGARFGAAPLGLYNRSFQLLMSPLSQLRAPTTNVALPVLSKLSDEPERYSYFLARGQLALGYSLITGLGVVIGASEPLTDVLLGEMWTDVAPLLRLLAVAGVFQTLAYVGYWVYLSRGLTSQLLRYTLVTATIKIACILIGSIWGVVGVAAGYALAPALAWPLSLWWLSRLTPIPTRTLLGGAGRVLTVTGLVAAASFAASAFAAPLGDIPRLILAVAAGLVAFAAIMAALPPMRRDARGIIEIVRAIPKERAAR